MTLRDVFHQAEREEPHSWLFLAGDWRQWTLKTEAFLFDPDDYDPVTDEAVLPAELKAKGVRQTLDKWTISDCVEWADRLVGRADDAVRLQSFIYYFRFDAFLPEIGAPDPPPFEETQRKLDLEFYNQLGPEDAAQRCKRDGCNRGTIRHSVLCKRHHFKMIQKWECPFEH